MQLSMSLLLSSLHSNRALELCRCIPRHHKCRCLSCAEKLVQLCCQRHVQFHISYTSPSLPMLSTSCIQETSQQIQLFEPLYLSPMHKSTHRATSGVLCWVVHVPAAMARAPQQMHPLAWSYAHFVHAAMTPITCTSRVTSPVFGVRGLKQPLTYCGCHDDVSSSSCKGHR